MKKMKKMKKNVSDGDNCPGCGRHCGQTALVARRSRENGQMSFPVCEICAKTSRWLDDYDPSYMIPLKFGMSNDPVAAFREVGFIGTYCAVYCIFGNNCCPKEATCGYPERIEETWSTWLKMKKTK